MRTTKLRSKLSLLFIALAALIAIPAVVALADNVQTNANDAAVDGNTSFTAGDSTSINYRITANNGDGLNGCNAADATSATVTINAPAGVTANPGSLTFTSCGTDKAVVFSSNTPGDYEITASVSDSGPGTYNTNPAKFTLHVLEEEDTNTPPTLSLPNNITAEATGPGGAAVSYTATASDAEDGSLTPSCTPPSGSTFALGTTQVNCSVTDSGGLEATGVFSVTVVDTTPPALTLPSDITKQATNNSQAQVNYTASASDLVDGTVAVTCTPASGSLFSAGTTTVNCSATDAAGNIATGSFKVFITYGFSGFRSPVDNIPTVNSVKAGSAVPIKFSLSGNQGLNIFEQGFPKATVSSCDNSAQVDAIEETVTAGGSSLSYDATADQYNYVWKTDKAWAGKCIQLEVKLKDQSSKFAKFKLLK